MKLNAKRTCPYGWDVFEGKEKIGRIFGIESCGRFLGRFGVEIEGRTYWSLGLYSPKEALDRIIKMLDVQRMVRS